nr:hypothetical protein BaRGS_023458 [Batillaria attramentaria]
MAELSEKLEVKKEQVEQKVGETKSDEMSAMYNMMLDTKRREQGLYDVDHTAVLMERRHDGAKARRRAKSAPRTKTDDKKDKDKKSKSGEKEKVDTPVHGDAPDHRRGKMDGAKSDTLAATSPSAIAAATVSLATAFGPQTPQNMLTLQVPDTSASSKPAPVPRPAKLTLKECYPGNSEKGKKAPSLNPALPPTAASVHVPPKPESGAGGKDVILEGGAVGGRDPAQEVAVGGSRTTLTSVEVHVSDPALARLAAPHLPVPVAAAGVSRAGGGLQAPTMDTLELPSLDLAMGGASWSTESLMGDSDNNMPSPEVPVAATAPAAASVAPAGASNFLQPFDLLDCSQRPVFHQQVPPHPLSLPGHRDAALATTCSDDVCVEGATAMQVDMTPAPPSNRAPHPRRPAPWDVVDAVKERGGEGDSDGLCSRLESSLRALTLDGVVGATGTSGNLTTDDEDYHEVEVIEEDDAALTGDSDHDHYFSAPLKKSKAVPAAAAAVHRTPEGAVGKQLNLVAKQLGLPDINHSLPSPDEQEEDALLSGAAVPITTTATPPVESRRPKRGSSGSQSQASSSGSKPPKRGSVASGQFGGKFKTPTTPMSWMVLRSPLARIESFHSDDFDYYNSSDTDHGERASVSGASTSPMSATTPTVPCFAYKLHMAKKKPPKLKKSCPDNTAGKSGKRTSSGDRSKGGATSKRLEPAVTDPLLSSGSETEHQDETCDKTGVASSKAKIHPISTD